MRTQPVTVELASSLISGTLANRANILLAPLRPFWKLGAKAMMLATDHADEIKASDILKLLTFWEGSMLMARFEQRTRMIYSGFFIFN